MEYSSNLYNVQRLHTGVRTSVHTYVLSHIWVSCIDCVHCALFAYQPKNKHQNTEVASVLFQTTFDLNQKMSRVSNEQEKCGNFKSTYLVVNHPPKIEYYLVFLHFWVIFDFVQYWVAGLWVNNQMCIFEFPTFLFCPMAPLTTLDLHQFHFENMFWRKLYIKI